MQSSKSGDVVETTIAASVAAGNSFVMRTPYEICAGAAVRDMLRARLAAAIGSDWSLLSVGF